MSSIPAGTDEGLSVTVNPTDFWTSQDRVPSPPPAGCIVIDSPRAHRLRSKLLGLDSKQTRVKLAPLCFT